MRTFYVTYLKWPENKIHSAVVEFEPDEYVLASTVERKICDKYIIDDYVTILSWSKLEGPETDDIKRNEFVDELIQDTKAREYANDVWKSIKDKK